jgi:hypothetical protein
MAALWVLGLALIVAWIVTQPPRLQPPYPVGQPGATPLAFIDTPTPLSFVQVAVWTPTPGRMDCGYRIEPASMRCLQLGAVRPRVTPYPYGSMIGGQ